MRSSDTATDTLVVGAGQNGLAAGYHLSRRGIGHLILESSPRVGDVWRSRYDSLRLYSPATDDALPGLPFPNVGERFPTGRQMGDYLEAYVRHHGLNVRTNARVDRLERDQDGGGYVVHARGQRYRASSVIIASGGFQRPWVPGFASELDPAIRQLHSSEYRNPHELQTGPALVVGLSHSGADIAHEVATSRRTYLSGKSHGQLPFPIDSVRGRMMWPIMKVLARNLLTLRTPIGRKMAPHVRAGGGPLLRHRRQELQAAGVIMSEARTVGVSDGRPRLADGQVLDVANVIWCTGFRPDFSWVRLPITGADGWPEQDRGVISSAPDLYVLGIPFLSGFTSMLVLGASRDADSVVGQIASRAGQRLSPHLAGAQPAS